MSRVKLYGSIEEMARDSSIVIVGTVVGQTEATDIDPITTFTISNLAVTEILQGSIPSNSKTVEVRQLGSRNESTPAPLMEVGGVYLLYLAASGLDGKLSQQYYITGGDAGLYAEYSGSPNGGETFAQVQAHDGENLPPVVTKTDATGAVGTDTKP